jgi:hypothetical protein
MKDLLFPKNVIVCGIEKNSKAEKAWWLRKIDRLVVKEEVPFEKAFPQENIEKKDETEKKINQPVEAEEADKKKNEGPISSFLGLIDALINFIKSIIKGILRLIGINM